jgi:peptide deformylase
MIIKLKTGETLIAEDKYIDISQKLILFIILEKLGDKTIKRKVFLNPEVIEFIKFESEAEEKEE